MKIRIFALAKELGLDSKVLIDLCNEAGLNIKASALASITPEEKDMVMKLLDGKGSAAAPVAEEPMAPVRPAPANKGRIRSLPKAGKAVEEGQDLEVEVDAAEEAETVPEDQGEVEAVEEPTPAVVEAEAPETPTADAVDPGDAPADTAPESSEPEAEVEDPEAGSDDAEPPAADPEAPKTAKPKPIVKDDFRPVGTVRPMREMKPIASVKEARKPKPKAAPALPSFAAPPS